MLTLLDLHQQFTQTLPVKYTWHSPTQVIPLHLQTKDCFAEAPDEPMNETPSYMKTFEQMKVSARSTRSTLRRRVLTVSFDSIIV